MDNHQITTPSKPRRALVAGLLSFIVPGLGHVYVGMPVRGASFLAFGISGWILLGLILRVLSTSWGYWTLIVILLSVYFGSMFDASRQAKRQIAYTLKPYNRWYVYLLIGILGSQLMSTLGAYRGQLFGYETYRIPSAGMTPTILVGDSILADTRRYRDAPPTRGDVVVYRDWQEPQIVYVKRIVAIPGDKIQYLDKRLVINGTPLTTTFVGSYLGGGADVNDTQQLYKEQQGLLSYEILLNPKVPRIALPNVKSFPYRETCQFNEAGFACVVPHDRYFVMGDNRDASVDSRYVGYISTENIVGQVTDVWMNAGQLHRIGKTIQ